MENGGGTNFSHLWHWLLFDEVYKGFKDNDMKQDIWKTIAKQHSYADWWTFKLNNNNKNNNSNKSLKWDETTLPVDLKESPPDVELSFFRESHQETIANLPAADLNSF